MIRPRRLPERPGRIAPLLVALALLGGACRTSAVPRQKITDATRLIEERFRAGDMLGVADFYSEEAILFAPGGRRFRGRKEIDDYWSNILEPVDWELKIHSIEGNRDMAFERGTSILSARYGGELRTSTVEFAFLWRREEDGAWRIQLDAFWKP
jgi:ketosteroid isomerase-like protein